MSGVRIGESSVETLVIVTDKAKSPLDMKVMTLEEVPPGQVPTKTTPAVRAGSKLKAIASKKASEGMIRYWAQTPEDGMEFNKLYNSADKALYYVKQNGKNAYHFFSDKLQKEKSRAGKIVDLKYINSLMSRADDGQGA